MRSSTSQLHRAITGVLFDLDGTLIDSEFLSPLAWGAVLREVGIQVEDAAVGRAIAAPELRGVSASAVADRLLQVYSVGPDVSDPAWMVGRKREVAVEMVRSGDVDLEPLWFDGVADAVRRLGQTIGTDAVGLCTSNLRPVAVATLEAVGVADVFGGGMTVQEDVYDEAGNPRLKPHPALYLRALEILGSPTESVAAVEDSIVGVRAAVTAGVGVVLGVLNRKGPNAAVECEEMTTSLLAAGAGKVFATTTDAINWCIANSMAASLSPPKNATSGYATSISEEKKSESECEVSKERLILEEKEAVVRRYFEGVNKKDHDMMTSCFAELVELRDMCSPKTRGTPRFARAEDMSDRCMEFLAAHPDCQVEFEEPPRCDRDGKWVWCHWYEKGTWSGSSRGISPKGTKLEVGGHTRFLLEERDGIQKIVKQVVFRTFSEWELSL